MAEKELTMEQMQSQFVDMKKAVDEMKTNNEALTAKLAKAEEDNQELKKVNNKLFLNMGQDLPQTKQEDNQEQEGEDKLDDLFDKYNQERNKNREGK